MISNKDKIPAPIGAVFTPLQYARETIKSCGLYEKWLNGAVILDPTAGSGNFIEAFLEIARDENETITNRMMKNLHALEMQEKFIEDFHNKIKREYNLDFPRQNFVQGDFLFSDLKVKADYLIGNPPWLNFCDLESQYKEKIKHLFLKTGLASNKKELLLGSSRIDIAALIICEAIRKNLKQEGEALFYLPLSLFLNDGAHKGFRSLLTDNSFSLNYICDYKNYSVFPDVSTRYGFASFTKGKKTTYPIDYYFINNSEIIDHRHASPIGERTSPFIIYNFNEKTKIPCIRIKEENRPRQGLNTCGANRLFIFDAMESLEKDLARVANKEISAILPTELLYPLIGADQFKKNEKNRYVFLPYKRNGRVLSEEELMKFPEAFRYVKKHKKTLINRKGVLIQNAIKRGTWWSLLGIGPYSFSPWKVVWEAYGKKGFKAEIFSEKSGTLWQPNQALQAFIPLQNKEDAERIAGELNNPIIEKLLKDQGMEGTCNWAQPGRMMKFFRIKDET